jgi:3',5'-cyclic-AMP phosphodiesterase
MERVSRREALAAATLGLAIPAAGLNLGEMASAAFNPARKRVLRFAHLTDIHVQPEKSAAEGLAACLRHVQSQADRPDMILTGGDQIMDAFGADFARTKVQWDLYAKVFKAENSLPVEHCIGNHDVWGWSSRESNPEHAVKSGKKWAMEALGLAAPYRTFEKAGWKFIVLDSTFPSGTGYTAKLDEEQFAWLKQTLEATPKSQPILILSHIPILAACAFFDGDNEKSGNWQVPGAWMHIDARKIKDLFASHENVKVAISGHIHLVDRVDYYGVTYLCNGAVSGGWWGGNYQECFPGYTLMNLYDDGTFDREYVNFGWKAK